jgi:hypothetical protein
MVGVTLVAPGVGREVLGFGFWVLGFRFWVSDEIGAAVYNKALTPKAQNPKPQSGATLTLKVL